MVVRWDRIAVFGIYLTPRLSSAEYSRRLDEMEGCARRHSLLSGPLLAAGDFNAKSPLWGSPRQDGKGRALQEWAAGLGLCILNTCTTSTCVRAQGESIVDLTWVSPQACRMVWGWRVAAEAETLSDHRYVEMRTAPSSRLVLPPPRNSESDTASGIR